MNGAGDRNRTDDLLITNQLLYQLSYTGSEPVSIRFLYREKQQIVGSVQ